MHGNFVPVEQIERDVRNERRRYLCNNPQAERLKHRWSAKEDRMIMAVIAPMGRKPNSKLKAVAEKLGIPYKSVIHRRWLLKKKKAMKA